MVDRPEKILLVDHTAVWSGGEVAIFNLCKNIDRLKFDTLVVTAAHGPLVDRLLGAGLKVRVLPLIEKVRARSKDAVGLAAFFNVVLWVHLLLYVFRLARLIKEERVDIVHTCSLKAHLYGSLAAKICGKPLVWHVMDHIDTPYLPKAAVIFYRILARVFPDLVVALSVSNGGKVNARPGRLRVINCGAAVGPGPDPLPDFPLKVTLLGRIAPWKGQHVFLEAARMLRDDPVEFIVAGAPLFGEYDYERTLFDFVDRNGLKNVRFAGFVENVREFLSGVHIMAHCSTSPEPFGQVIIEAMAAGRMVIATKTGGPAEIVHDGVTGILVRPGRPGDLAAAIKRALDSPDMIAEFGARGYRLALEKYDIRILTGEWEGIYLNLSGGKKRGRCG